MNATELARFLSSLPPGERDRAVEEYLGVRETELQGASPGEHLIGYQPSGVASIVRALAEVPVVPSDVFVDLGSGLGKVVMLARIFSGAVTRGVELDGAFVRRARTSAARLHLDVDFDEADARHARLDDGTVFFLYLPFTGPVLDAVLGRLRAVAERRAIVVCALGVELERTAPWLVPRPTDDLWLTLYDSGVPGVPPRLHEGRRPIKGWDASS